MPDYSLGKIYKIISSETDLVYVGSTAQKYLSSRMSIHRYEYGKWLNDNKKYTSSFDILKYPDAQIILIEKFPCNDKEELCKKEQEYIQSMNCVNKQKAYTGIDSSLSKKEYNNEYKRIYKESIINYQKQYRITNKEKINEKYTCECGSIIRKDSRGRHIKSLKHQNYFN